MLEGWGRSLPETHAKMNDMVDPERGGPLFCFFLRQENLLVLQTSSIISRGILCMFRLPMEKATRSSLTRI